MNVIQRIVIAAGLVAVTAGCTKEIVHEREVGPGAVSNGGPRETVSVAANLPEDELVDAGEQLIGPFTFHLADRAFQMALERNPANKKAQFYRAFLKQFMLFRGALDRVRPYARQYGNATSLEKTIRDLPDHPLKHFLLDSTGQAPIANVDDIQKFLIQYRNAANDFRVFIAKNPDLEFNIYLNPSLWKDQVEERLRNSCVVTGTGDNFQVSCDSASAARLKVNAADLQVIRQNAAGEVLYFTLYTAYSVKGLEGLMDDITKSSIEECSSYAISSSDGSSWSSGTECTHPYRQLTSREVIERLQAAPEALKLNQNNGLATIRSISSELSAAAKWVMQRQRSLCREGRETSRNRPGQAIDKGLCVTDTTNAQKSLALLDQLLGGVARVSVTDALGHERMTDLNAFAMVDHPVTDLRQLAPSSYGRCDTATGLSDKTLGGLFPRGDAESIVLEPCGL